MWAKLLILAYIAGDVSFVRSQGSQQEDGGGEYDLDKHIFFLVVLTKINVYTLKNRSSYGREITRKCAT